MPSLIHFSSPILSLLWELLRSKLPSPLSELTDCWSLPNVKRAPLDFLIFTFPVSSKIYIRMLFAKKNPTAYKKNPVKLFSP